MKYLIYSLFLFFLLPALLRAQDSAVIYMNSDFEAVDDIKTAVIKRHAVIKNDRYYISDQYVDGRKIMKGEYNSVNPWTEDGPFIFYDHKGNKYAEGNFVNGAMDGRWIYFDSTGTDTVFYKKEWMDLVKSGIFYKYTDELVTPNEEFYNYVLNHVHFPPRYLLDCVPRGEMFHIVISQDREISVKPFFRNLENDFSFELYRVLNEVPDTIVFHDDNKKTSYYTVSINYNCPDKVYNSTTNPCEGPTFVFVEQQARFQGGNLEDFRTWVQMNLIYPPQSVQNGEMGRITVQYTVTSHGKVDCIKILRSSGYNLLDKEAMRVVADSPLWVPARQGGKAVNQQFVMPVIFQLQ